MISLAYFIHFLINRPQDMEFAVDANGNIYVLQTRPITCLNKDDEWDPDPIPEGLPPWYFFSFDLEYFIFLFFLSYVFPNKASNS